MRKSLQPHPATGENSFMVRKITEEARRHKACIEIESKTESNLSKPRLRRATGLFRLH
jgi:hypothetical protein